MTPRVLERLFAASALFLTSSALFPLLRGVGGTHPGGAALLSYLLFAPGFCNALIKLGHADANTKRAEIQALMAPRT